MFIEPHSIDVLVNADDAFSGHHLADGRAALLLTATLCRCLPVGSNLEMEKAKDCGQREPAFIGNLDETFMLRTFEWRLD